MKEKTLRMFAKFLYSYSLMRMKAEILILYFLFWDVSLMLGTVVHHRILIHIF